MVASVARKGRHCQRYENGFRLVAGCIPYRYKSTGDSERRVEVLMVTPQRGPGLMFPKGGWENDETKEEAACREAFEEAGVQGNIGECLGSWTFTSKRHRGEHSIEGSRKGYMFPLSVTEELDSWPEKDARQRQWVTVPEAMDKCRHDWMQAALEKLVNHLSSPESVDGSASTDSSSQLSDEEHLQQSTELLACEEMVSILTASKSVDTLSSNEPSRILTESLGLEAR